MHRYELAVWLVLLASGLIAHVIVAVVASVGEYSQLAEISAGVMAGIIGLVTMRIMVLAGTPGVFAEIIPTVGPEPGKSIPARAAEIADALLHHHHDPST